jgi:hypothetical protein
MHMVCLQSIMWPVEYTLCFHKSILLSTLNRIDVRERKKQFLQYCFNSFTFIHTRLLFTPYISVICIDDSFTSSNFFFRFNVKRFTGRFTI